MTLSVDIRDWVIYKITNPTGRVYIGKTTNYKKRVGDYRNINCKNQKLVYHSLLKYGFESHRVEVIDTFYSDNTYANDKEMFWVRSYMSNLYKFPHQSGMNLTDGGDGKLGHKHSEETKKKLSDYNKANPSGKLSRGLTPEQQRKRSLTIKGRPSPLKGRVSEKVRLRRLEPPKEKWASLKGVTPKFISVENQFKKGHTPWTKGKKMPEDQVEKLRMINKGNKYNVGKKHSRESVERGLQKRRRPVIQFSLSGEFIEEFDSILSAHKKTKMGTNSIGAICRGKVKPKIYVFKYKAA